MIPTKDHCQKEHKNKEEKLSFNLLKSIAQMRRNPLPARTGHFVTESSLHIDKWIFYSYDCINESNFMALNSLLIQL